METTPNGRPAPFVIKHTRRWVECDDPAYEGFAIYVSAQITNAEREVLADAHDAIMRYETTEYPKLVAAATKEGKGAEVESPREREMRLIAPLVFDWNAVGLTDAGDEAPIPPPAVGGPAVFSLIFPDQYDWIVRAVLLGYRTGKGAGSWQGGSRRGSGPQIVKNPES